MRAARSALPTFSLATLAVLGSAASASAQVRSQRANDDGVYGRFANDLVFSIGANGGIGLGDPTTNDAALAVQGELRLRVLDSAGLVLAPEWRPNGTSRFVAVVDLRPMFLTRLYFGLATGDRYLDLLVDSIGLELGAAIEAPLGDAIAAFSLGFGAEVPLWIPESNSGALALRLGARWVGAGLRYAGGSAEPMDDWTLSAGLLVRFHASVGIASWEPSSYELPAR